jgi:hypothetical protein
MPITDSDMQDIFRALQQLCMDCAARAGFVTHGMSARPRPSTCWACSATESVFGKREDSKNRRQGPPQGSLPGEK